ncbi:MAG: class I SAM-dependent RNA methyltransferase [Betaproteobacteria bacterium]|nr:class I SAM-dependent RNA methyltransferase [Betaproteobacteria bacterium]
MVPHQFFAPCPRGLESVLAGELAALGAVDARPTEGGVHFEGDWAAGYRANLESRVASRILWQAGRSRYRSENDVYRAAHDLPWDHWFSAEQTIRVNVAAQHCPLRSLDFVTLHIKDAVCDRFRAVAGRRPSVDTVAPGVRIHAFLDAQEITLYLDTSGEPLFKRGYRKAGAEAPLRENLASGILQLAGWAPGIPLLDPLCGSGTFLLEAAQIALGLAPGRGRSFAFETLKVFDRSAWDRVRHDARTKEREIGPQQIYGSDLYGEALKAARANLSAAGIEAAVHLKQANVLEISPPAPEGLIVTNPPYGVRVGEQQELAAFYPRLGDVLKQRFAGWRACIFSADMALPKLIGLKPSKRTPLYNGALECRLFEYRMVAGSMRRQKGVSSER